ncbi:MAG: acetolactate synthase large subunit [Trueperaceae bacterium]|nr:acetolactate synthase large subunit [Trueperaceae bacterium]
MNGAESLIKTLVKNNVNVCFANPGTSEMHFVAALDAVPQMRGVLGLFEGVCSGAADAYYRMTGKPACTLMHCGPGMANGIANLHNAWRAQSGMVNIVGDHASFHLQHDAPLTTDIVSLAKPFSGWIRSSASASAISQDAADAITVARGMPGQIATLILPADTAWTEASGELIESKDPVSPQFSEARALEIAGLLENDGPTLLLLSGLAAINEGLELASRIAEKTGAQLMTNRPTARLQRGAGRPVLDALAYPVPDALKQLGSFKTIILVGTEEPVSFFGYPNSPSRLAPEGAKVVQLASADENVLAALEYLAEELDAQTSGERYKLALPDLPYGDLTLDKVFQSVAALMPDETIMVNEAITSFRGAALATARPHDVLQGTGGAIGHGLPESVGAAVACPDRKVLCLQADGSAMYTIQGLWSMARENLDVVTVLFNNRAYRILQGEMTKVGAMKKGQTADQLLNLDNPVLDFVSIAQGMGVEASRALSADAFNDQLAAALTKQGPHLIEIMV